MHSIQEAIADSIRDKAEECERQGFDACLAMMCSMGNVETAVEVLEETERRLPGFKARRDQLRVRCDLSQWPELYGETT